MNQGSNNRKQTSSTAIYSAFDKMYLLNLGLLTKKL